MHHIIVAHVEQERLTLPEHLGSQLFFSWACVARLFFFYLMSLRSCFVLFVLHLPLYCLSFDFRLLIAPGFSSDWQMNGSIMGAFIDHRKSLNGISQNTTMILCKFSNLGLCLILTLAELF